MFSWTSEGRIWRGFWAWHWWLWNLLLLRLREISPRWSLVPRPHRIQRCERMDYRAGFRGADQKKYPTFHLSISWNSICNTKLLWAVALVWTLFRYHSIYDSQSKCWWPVLTARSYWNNECQLWPKWWALQNLFSEWIEDSFQHYQEAWCLDGFSPAENQMFNLWCLSSRSSRACSAWKDSLYFRM